MRASSIRAEEGPPEVDPELAHYDYVPVGRRRLRCGTSLTTSAVVKRHVRRSGCWSRLSYAYEPAEAAVPLSVVPFAASTLSVQSVSPHHDGLAHHTSLRSRRTMMTSANSLLPREAGRLFTNGRSLIARTMFHTRPPRTGRSVHDDRRGLRRQNSSYVT
jgi:hypothetical protein